jgi:predicted TIM-barrel fold metal-dependent hydrolase
LADPEVIEATGKDKIRTVLTKTIVDNPETVLFGSDYACCDRGMHIELIKSLPISESVREMVFWKNAVKLFKLNIKKNGMT